MEYMKVQSTDNEKLLNKNEQSENMKNINELLCDFASKNCLDDIKALLAIGADVNYVGRNIYNSPLINSAYNGHIKIVEFFIEFWSRCTY